MMTFCCLKALHFKSVNIIWMWIILCCEGYYLSFNRFARDQSETFCNKFCNSNLASIHTKDEYQQIIKLITKSSVSPGCAEKLFPLATNVFSSLIHASENSLILSCSTNLFNVIQPSNLLFELV